MLNRSQQQVFNEAIKWWKSGNEQTFEISGPPGSGKTFLLNYIIDSLNIDRDKIAPMAYTGAAAINMRNHGLLNARTCYSWLYDCIKCPVLDENGYVVMDKRYNKPKMKIKFVEKRLASEIDLIIVDEAGSVPPEIRQTIDRQGIPVIATGDLDQLPPIQGKSAYLNNPYKVHVLTEIMRQNADNSIIFLSQQAKNGQPINNGWYKNTLVIYEDELTIDMIKKSQIILCGKNNTRETYTNYIRKNVVHRSGNLPNYGERVVCRKNNWSIESNGINLTNGLLGTVINDPYVDKYDAVRKTYNISFKPDLCSLPFNDIECDYEYLMATPQARNDIKNNPYSFGEKFEFGYVVTTHIAQGSEFDNGIYIEEWLNPQINNKLNYVGLTRFKNFCIYVKRRPKKYF